MLQLQGSMSLFVDLDDVGAADVHLHLAQDRQQNLTERVEVLLRIEDVGDAQRLLVTEFIGSVVAKNRAAIEG